MKKTALFVLFSAFLLVPAAGRCDSGAVTGSRANGPDAARYAHRAELIEEHKKYPKNEPGPVSETKASKFWKNEADRSGVSGWKAPSMDPRNFFKNQDRKYKERKAAK